MVWKEAFANICRLGIQAWHMLESCLVLAVFASPVNIAKWLFSSFRTCEAPGAFSNFGGFAEALQDHHSRPTLSQILRFKLVYLTGWFFQARLFIGRFPPSFVRFRDSLACRLVGEEGLRLVLLFALRQRAFFAQTKWLIEKRFSTLEPELTGGGCLFALSSFLQGMSAGMNRSTTQLRSSRRVCWASVYMCQRDLQC